MDCPMNASPRPFLSAVSSVFVCVLVPVTVFFCVGGPDSVDSGQAPGGRWSLIAEGEAAKEKGHYIDALAAFQKALALTNKGKDPKRWAFTASSVAQMHKYLGSLTEAEKLYTEILKLREELYGFAAPETAETRTNLVLLLTTMNRLDKAESLLNRTLFIHKNSLGIADANGDMMRRMLARADAAWDARPGHVSMYLINTTALRDYIGPKEEAEPLLRRALAIEEASFGKDHPNVAIRLNNLGQLLQATDRMVEAAPLMGRIVAIFVDDTIKSRRTSPYLWEAIENYRGLLRIMGESEAGIKEKIGKLMEPLSKK